MARSRRIEFLLDPEETRHLFAGRRVVVAVAIDGTPRSLTIQLAAGAVALRRPLDPPEAREFLPAKRRQR